jgi:hypothetical protein
LVRDSGRTRLEIGDKEVLRQVCEQTSATKPKI